MHLCRGPMSAVLELQAPSEIRTLRGLSSALCSAEDVDSAASAVASCLRGTLGQDTFVTISQPDSSRRLRVVWRDAEIDVAVGLPRSARRRATFATMRSTRVDVRESGDRFLAMFPLACRGEAVGVLEVLAAGPRIEAMWEVLEVVANQLAMALYGIAQRERPGRQDGEVTRAMAPALALRADRDRGPDELDLTLAWTAHELRGPLVALKAVLGLLSEYERPAAHESLLVRCLSELDEMSVLIEDTLRWGVGGKPPRRRDCDLVRIVKDSIQQCGLELGVDRVSLQTPPQAFARVEPVQLRGAISNLVRNALMYSPADSPVEVVVEADVDFITVTVRNAGRDIPREDREAIFLPYVRGASAEAQFGTGLGLFITRRVAEANGGRLSLVSENGATEFRLEIPRGAM